MQWLIASTILIPVGTAFLLVHILVLREPRWLVRLVSRILTAQMGRG